MVDCKGYKWMSSDENKDLKEFSGLSKAVYEARPQVLRSVIPKI